MGRSGESIEDLYVKIEADIEPLLRQTAEGVDRVEDKLEDVERTGTGAFDKIGNSIVNKILKLRLLEKALNLIVGLVTRLAKIGVDTFKSISKGAIDANAQFEMFHAGLTTLLGSTEAADARLRELIKFAIKTPFELPGIIEASRTLQIFGGDALATGDNLTLVGDIAAGVNRQFEDVALWVGRLYDAMQSGQPFGIAATYLQRMGALTGQARRELEQMQEEGATGAEMWQRFNEIVGPKFSGNMDRMSGTLQGVISNLKDMAWNLMRVGGEDAFKVVRDAAKRLFDLLERERPTLEKIAKAVGDIAANVADFLSTELFTRLEELDTSALLELMDGLWVASENARVLVEMLMLLGDDSTIGPIDALTWAVEKLSAAFDMAIPLVGGYVAATSQEEDTLVRLTEILEEHNQRVKEHGEVSEEAADGVDAYTDAIRERLQAIQQEIDALKAATEAEQELAEEFATDLLDVQADMNERLAELDRDHFQRLGEIVAAIAERKAEAIRKANEKLAELEQETARQRADMEADYRQQQVRAEEDHNREMMRLRLRLQDDLQDAIKNRDARAIVDLLRRYKRERQEREEDYSVRQRREREDQEQRLRDLEENERRRRQEIKDSLRQQLADLDRSQAQQIAKENQNYRQRQAELGAALAKRLATIAKELADEEKVNEAGARRILAALNKTFGIGGDIDALMEDFAARRRQKMIVRVSFEPDYQQPPSRRNQPQEPGLPPGTVEFQRGGAMVATRPTLAQFGEVPELATFTPLSKLGAAGGELPEQHVVIEFKGSAPPGIRSAEREAIAGVVVQALKATGVLKVRG